MNEVLEGLPRAQPAANVAGTGVPLQTRTSLWSMLARLSESPVAMIGISLIGFWVLVALFAPWITQHAFTAQDVSALANPYPSHTHILGVDHLGRDVWSRLAYGARTVLTLAPTALLVAYTLGCTLGLVSAYFGGWIDHVISRVSDLILSFPVLVLYIVLITALGPSKFNIVLAITLGSAPGIGRIVRGLALDLRNQEYISAAQLRGESALYIMLVELLPNARGPLIVDACLRMGYVIIKIGALGFLGLGLPPPNPEWGGMAKDATPLIFAWPHMAIFPCVAISSLVVGFNLLADGLRDISLRD